MSRKIKPRHKIVAFYGVPGTDQTIYTRMHKFTQFTENKNPQEYNRQYVDEPYQQTDIVGYAPQFDYGFDRHSDDTVQADIIDITDKEKIGDDAVRSIIVVDIETGKAWKRDYSVIPGTEGDNINVYTYSGSLKARGEKVFGMAASTDEWETITFTEDSD